MARKHNRDRVTADVIPVQRVRAAGRTSSAAERYGNVPASAAPASPRPSNRPLQYRLMPDVQLDSPANAAAFCGIDTGSSRDVHAAAAEGVAGPRTALPHARLIQSSFGRHDISGISAHIGGAAADACDAMNANAYATGDNVAFASEPDLHTAAHEAAHVIQQRAGVQLSGGVGQAGDAYEQHADRVADLVVRGESAEAELGVVGGGATTGALQYDAKPERMSDTDHANYARLLLRAAAAEAANTLAELDSANGADAELAFVAGCKRVSLHLHQALRVVSSANGSKSAAFSAPETASAAFTWTERMLAAGERAALGRNERADLDATLNIFAVRLALTGWERPAPDNAESSGRRDAPQMSEDDRGRTTELALRTAHDGIAARMSILGADSETNAGVVSRAAVFASPHLEYAERTMRLVTESSGAGVGDPYPESSKLPKPTEAGQRHAGIVESVLETIDELIDAGAESGANVEHLTELYRIAVALKHHAGVATTPTNPQKHAAYVAAQNRALGLATRAVVAWGAETSAIAGIFAASVDPAKPADRDALLAILQDVGMDAALTAIFGPATDALSDAGKVMLEATKSAVAGGFDGLKTALSTATGLAISPELFVAQWVGAQVAAQQGLLSELDTVANGRVVTQRELDAAENLLEVCIARTGEESLQTLLAAYMNALYDKRGYELTDMVDGDVERARLGDGMLVIQIRAGDGGDMDDGIPFRADVGIEGLDQEKLNGLVERLGVVDPVGLGVPFAVRLYELESDWQASGAMLRVSEGSLFFDATGSLATYDERAAVAMRAWGGTVPAVAGFGAQQAIVGWSKEVL